MSTAERVLLVLEKVAETDAVRKNPEIDLFGHQILDSMKTVELMLAFKSEFAIDISPAEFDPELWATPRKVVEDIEKRLGR